jgi:hypothetical protein
MAGGSGKVGETSAQVALAEHAKNVMDDYKTRWLPVQQKLAANIESLQSPKSSLRAESAGRAANDEAIQFAGARDKAIATAAARGIQAGGGKFNLGVTGMGSAEAKGSGLNEVLSDEMVNDAYTKGLTALMQIGQGQAAEVGQGLASQARASGLQAQADAQAALTNTEDNVGVLGSAVGFGAQQWAGSRPPPVVQGSNPNGYGGVLNNPSAFVATGT